MKCKKLFFNQYSYKLAHCYLYKLKIQFINHKIVKMKKALFILGSLITFMFFTSDVSAQISAKEIRVLVDNPGSDRVFKDKEKKKLDFAVQGLATGAEVTEFTNRVKAFEGVKSVTVSESLVNGARPAHIEFNETFQESYFQKLLAHSHVDLLVVNGKRKPVKSEKSN